MAVENTGTPEETVNTLLAMLRGEEQDHG